MTILKNRKFVLLRVLDLIFSRKLDHLVKRLVTTFCIRHLEQIGFAVHTYLTISILLEHLMLPYTFDKNLQILRVYLAE